MLKQMIPYQTSTSNDDWNLRETLLKNTSGIP